MSTLAKPVENITPVTEAEPTVPWTMIAWFGALLILCYLPILIRLTSQWISDEDMGHGFFVPVIASYIAWQKRSELLSRPFRPNYAGLALVIYAAVQGYIGVLGAELFLSRTAFVVALVGAVLFLGGTHAIRVLKFPLLLLLFMVPIPAVIYNKITFPLQLFASQVAAFVLEILGYPVLREGNVLELPSQKLNVVEACSGIRSLLSLTFLSLVYAHFFDDKGWMKPVLFLATIPIAILANAGRVTLTGVMSEIDTELAQGIMHTAQGWVIFMIALIGLVVAHQIINRAYGFWSKRAH